MLTLLPIFPSQILGTVKTITQDRANKQVAGVTQSLFLARHRVANRKNNEAVAEYALDQAVGQYCQERREHILRET